MIRRPPRSTLFPYTDALPIYGDALEVGAQRRAEDAERRRVIRAREWQLLADRAVRLQRLAELADRIADRKSTRLNSSHGYISYAVFCLKKKKKKKQKTDHVQT